MLNLRPGEESSEDKRLSRDSQLQVYSLSSQVDSGKKTKVTFCS